MDWFSNLLNGAGNVGQAIVNFILNGLNAITKLIYLAPADVAEGAAYAGKTAGVQFLGYVLIAGATLGIIGFGWRMVKGLIGRSNKAVR